MQHKANYITSPKSSSDEAYLGDLPYLLASGLLSSRQNMKMAIPVAEYTTRHIARTGSVNSFKISEGEALIAVVAARMPDPTA